jgi:hypothetical protein
MITATREGHGVINNELKMGFWHLASPVVRLVPATVVLLARKKLNQIKGSVCILLTAGVHFLEECTVSTGSGDIFQRQLSRAIV